jgi:hypothetical protein
MANLIPVSFTLTLQQGWFGRFAGTVTEEGKGAMPGTGRIEGYFLFPRIEFRKWMPVCYLITPEGEGITFREWAVRQGYKCQRDIPHGPIRYSGEFTDMSKAEGIWILQAGTVAADDTAFDMPEAKGTWRAEKVDLNPAQR